MNKKFNTMKTKTKIIFPGDNNPVIKGRARALMNFFDDTIIKKMEEKKLSELDVDYSHLTDCFRVKNPKISILPDDIINSLEVFCSFSDLEMIMTEFLPHINIKRKTPLTPYRSGQLVPAEFDVMLYLFKGTGQEFADLLKKV